MNDRMLNQSGNRLTLAAVYSPRARTGATFKSESLRFTDGPDVGVVVRLALSRIKDVLPGVSRLVGKCKDDVTDGLISSDDELQRTKAPEAAPAKYLILENEAPSAALVD